MHTPCTGADWPSELKGERRRVTRMLPPRNRSIRESSANLRATDFPFDSYEIRTRRNGTGRWLIGDARSRAGPVARWFSDSGSNKQKGRQFSVSAVSRDACTSGGLD